MKLFLVVLLSLSIVSCEKLKKGITFIASDYFMEKSKGKKWSDEYKSALAKYSVLPEVVDDDQVPPLPNLEEDKKTLSGIDSDHDGLRDDLEIFINIYYKNSNLRKAAKFRAKGILRHMESFKDKERCIENSYIYEKATSCFIFLMSASEEVEDYVSQIGIISYLALNTKERRLASKTSDSFLYGSVYKSYVYNKEVCPFEIENYDKLIKKYREMKN